MDFINKIIQINCLHGLDEMPDESVDCCITSPPYWNLRDYGVDGQLGLEPIDFLEWFRGKISIDMEPMAIIHFTKMRY